MTAKKEVEADKLLDELSPVKKKGFDFGPDDTIIFSNVESPEAPLLFSFQGRKFGPLDDGSEYKLPRSVISHLNSLTVPDYKLVTDPVTGHQRSERIANRRRFACVPVG